MNALYSRRHRCIPRFPDEVIGQFFERILVVRFQVCVATFVDVDDFDFPICDNNSFHWIYNTGISIQLRFKVTELLTIFEWIHFCIYNYI